MNLLPFIERLLQWASRHSKTTAAFLTAAVTALGGALGPAWVEDVKERAEKQRARSELVTKVIDATASLDPADPKTVLRFGVVADLVADNNPVFGLKIDQAAARLRRLSDDLKRGSIGVLDGAIERTRRELQGLAESAASLREVAAKLRADDTTRATNVGNANSNAPKPVSESASANPAQAVSNEPSRAVIDLLEGLAKRQDELASEVKRAQETQREARTRFSKELEDATRQRQDAEKLLGTLKDLKEGLGSKVDSQQRALSIQVESAKVSLTQTVQELGARLQTDLGTLSAEREAIAQKRLELSTQSAKLFQQQQAIAAERSNLESQRRELQAQADRQRLQNCERTDFELFKQHMKRVAEETPQQPKGAVGVKLVNPESNSGAVTIEISYPHLKVEQDPRVQRKLEEIASHLIQLGIAQRDVRVQGYVYHRKKPNEAAQPVMKDSVEKAFSAFDYLTSQFRKVSDEPLRRFSVNVAGPPPDSTPNANDRIELTVGENALAAEGAMP